MWTKKDRIFYLNAKSILALDLYLNERKDNNPYLFPAGFYKATQGYAGVRKDWYKYPNCPHIETKKIYMEED